MTKTETILKKFGDETVALVQKDIKSKRLIKTGDLLRSISYTISGQSIDFDMIYYGEYLDKGTKYIYPRNFFNEIIKKQLKKYKGAIAKAIFLDNLNIKNNNITI